MQIIAVQTGRKHDNGLVLATIKQAIAKAQTHPLIFNADKETEFMARPCSD